MKINQLLLSVFLLILVACEQTSQNDLPQITGYEKELSNGAGIEIDSFYMVPLELTDNTLISYIDKMDFIDSLIFIQTSDKVLSFNRKGKFMYSYGNKGGGEGEYMTLGGMVLDKKKREVHLIDNYSSKIYSFSLDGQFLSAKKHEELPFSLLQHAEYLGSSVLFYSNFIYNDKNTIYSLFDIENQKETELYSFPVKTDNAQEYTGKCPFSIYNDTLKCIIPFDNKIYTYQDGELQPYVSIKANKPLVKANEIEALEYFSFMTYAHFLNEHKFVGFTDIFETQNHLLLSFSNYSYFLIDKRANAGTLYRYSLPEKLKSEVPFFKIIATDGDYFVGVIEPFKLQELDFDTRLENSYLQEIEEFLSTVNEEDNPVLFFYKIK